MDVINEENMVKINTEIDRITKQAKDNLRGQQQPNQNHNSQRIELL